VGVALLGAAALAGLLLARGPARIAPDAAGYFYVPSDPGLASRKRAREDWLAAGAAGRCSRDLLRRDLPRLGTGFRNVPLLPIVAVEVVEHIANPMVGREIGAGSFHPIRRGRSPRSAALAAAVFLVSPDSCVHLAR